MSRSNAEPETFGDILRRERENAGITQEELAERAGLSRNAISSLERGERRRPYPFTVRSLVAALGLSSEDGLGLAAAVPTRASASDDHRTPDEQPDRVPERFPRLSTTPLFGRELEVAGAVSLLMGGTTRLLTLLGPGGVGKTALSLAVADVLAPHLRDGVTIVSLAQIGDLALVLPAIAFAVGLREESERPVAQTLVARLHDRQTLLLLDNAEHLTAIGPSLADLLAACPGLMILVTSREALHVRDERVLVVPPLALPEMADLPRWGDIADVPAVALFVQRARAVRSDFRLTEENAPTVVAICARLDGLPLAIELAAARVPLLPPAALLARLERRLPLLGGGLRDAPERHRTLRRTIAWSYDLLTPDEQLLFQRIAVFAGGATLESVEALAWSQDESERDGSDVLDLLGQLIDKSLMRPSGADEEDPRVEMLETIREYAWERLNESGEQDAVERSHALHFVALAERAAPRRSWSGPIRSAGWRDSMPSASISMRR